eukprot:g3553.t1
MVATNALQRPNNIREVSKEDICERQFTTGACALVSVAGVHYSPDDRNPTKACMWCVKDFATNGFCKTITEGSVNYYEKYGYNCVPHISSKKLMGVENDRLAGSEASEQIEKRLWGTFRTYQSLSAEDSNIIPVDCRSIAWTEREFCKWASSIFGADERIDDLELKTTFKGEEISKEIYKTIDSEQMETWLDELYETTPERINVGLRFLNLCTGIFGDICSEDCHKLSELYDASTRIGVESTGRGEGYVNKSARWIKREEKNEDDDDEDTESEEEEPLFKYRLDPNDCFNCITEGSCTPSCLLDGSCRGDN